MGEVFFLFNFSPFYLFYIQINSMGQKVDIPLNAVRNLSQEEQKVLVDSMYTPIDDAQAEEIMNS